MASPLPPRAVGQPHVHLDTSYVAALLASEGRVCGDGAAGAAPGSCRSVVGGTVVAFSATPATCAPGATQSTGIVVSEPIMSAVTSRVNVIGGGGDDSSDTAVATGTTPARPSTVVAPSGSEPDLDLVPPTISQGILTQRARRCPVKLFQPDAVQLTVTADRPDGSPVTLTP